MISTSKGIFFILLIYSSRRSHVEMKLKIWLKSVFSCQEGISSTSVKGENDSDNFQADAGQ